MATQYIGARYVPIVYKNPDDGSANWKANVEYEPLTIVVDNNGDSYTSRKAVPASIGRPSENGEYWVKTGDFNASLLALRREVQEIDDDINDETNGLKVKVTDLSSRMISAESSIDNLEMDKIMKPHILHGNLVIDYAISNEYDAQGACYIGNNKIVIYYASDNDIGLLKCFNLETQSLEWEYSIKGYHGNAICYRPLDNCIYICAMEKAGETNLTNIVVVIDMDDPTTVKEEIIAPVDSLYSIAYDASTDTFYSINARGSVNGVANELYVYDGIFESVNRHVTLESHPAVKYGVSTQGIQMAKDGIVYMLAYGYSNHYIVGNDVNDGKALLYAKQPTFINGYRDCGESESIIYDFDDDKWFIGANFNRCGLKGYNVSMVYEIDLFKGIDSYDYSPYSGAGAISSSVISYVDFANALSIKPLNNKDITRFKFPQDAINSLILAHAYGIVNVRNNGDYIVNGIMLNGFNGRIQGSSNTDRVTIENLPALNGNKCCFLWCNFTGHTDSYSIHLERQSDVSIFQSDVNDDDNVTTHYFAEEDSHLFLRSDVVTNSSKRKYLAGSGGTITLRRGDAFTITNGSNFTPVANTYVYTGMSITVEQYTKRLVMVNGTANSSTPDGIIISDSDSDATGSHVLYKYENDTAKGNTPVTLLPYGTYYIWMKYSTTSAEHPNMYDKIIDVGY